MYVCMYAYVWLYDNVIVHMYASVYVFKYLRMLMFSILPADSTCNLGINGIYAYHHLTTANITNTINTTTNHLSAPTITTTTITAIITTAINANTIYHHRHLH